MAQLVDAPWPRRRFLGGVAGLGTAAVAPAVLGSPHRGPGARRPPTLTEAVLAVEGAPRLARQALLLSPPGLAPDAPAPLLVLLHGLGETDSEAHGLRAWADLYGLKSAHARLTAGRFVADRDRHARLTAARAAALDAELARSPLPALRVLCPFTPNVHRRVARVALDDYAGWLVERLIPTVSRRVAVTAVGLDGCSLGGFIALETTLRHPRAFDVLGLVQAAFRADRAGVYSAGLARALAIGGPRPLQLMTSTLDVYRKANEALSRRLRAQGTPHRLLIPRGGHDQPFLRDVGTVEMLLWHARQLRGRQQAMTLTGP